MAISETQVYTAAKIAAKHEVAGFVLHDKKDYLGAGREYGNAYVIIDSHRPGHLQVGEYRALEAGMHKIGVLAAYDSIVEDPAITIFSHPNVELHPKFSEMVHHAIQECEAFGIPHTHGLKRIDWYRLHADWVKTLAGTKTVPSADGHPFVAALTESDSAFIEGLTLNNGLHLKTSPLLLECVYYHDHRRINGLDEHHPSIVEKMEETYAQYLTLLFENMQLNKSR